MTGRTLRICYVVSFFHPVASGAEKQALAQAAEFVRRGHQARVVTRHLRGYPVNDVLEGVQVHRWIRPVSFGPMFGVTFVAGVIRALRRLRPEYDLIQDCQGLWEATATGLGRRWLGGAPVLVQPASSGPYGEALILARTTGAPVLRRLILRNTAFEAISAEIEREWLDLGVPPSRMFRMASGVDLGRFRPGPVPREAESSLPPRPRVAFLGRLHPQKNLDRLIDAWPTVAARTAANLVLIGQGADRDRLAEKVRGLGIADRVHFAGQAADPADLLRSADVFALPSVAEGMSNALLEAMATALPCVASAIGGNTDLIDDGRSGLLVPADDTAAWSAALLRVLNDPALAASMGQAARARMEAEFSIDAVVDRYEALYRKLLAEVGR